jgi:RNA polymerase sigma-70 factor, ECF subfamily
VAGSPVPSRPALTAEAGGPSREDLALVERLVASDSAAWQTLIQRFQRLVFARVLATARELNRPLNPSDAEDLCAEVFSRLIADEYAALRRFEGRSTLSTWLAVVTRRIVLRRISTLAREPSHPTARPPLETLPAPPNEEPLASMIGDEERAQLAAGMAQLGERHRQLARLFYFEKRSYREISQELDMPMNSVGPTLARIHQKLREAMKQGE